MDANEVLAWLERRGTRRTVEGMARYGLKAKRAEPGGPPASDSIVL